jgi:hypothetical protein
MGCCFFAIIGALWPRLALIFIWLFKPAIPNAAFHTTLYPVLGLIFLPTTTLTYELIKYYHPSHSIDNGYLLFLALAFLYDLGHVGLGMRGRKRD